MEKKVTKKKEIEWEYSMQKLEAFSAKFISTLVDSQLNETQKYRKYMSVLSDHAPISMNCTL